MKRTFLLFAFLAAAPLSARVIPAIEAAAPVPDVQVLDEAGNSTSLRSLLAAMGGGPVVVLPIYTRCAVSCPLQTQKLKQALAGLNPGAPLRILVFSFDPEETAGTIRQYRELEGVPESWSVIRAREAAIRTFFDFFHYWVMDEKGQLVHPDRIFLLDPSLQWRFTVTGVNWSPQEIGQALGQARSPGIMLWMRTHPDALAWAGFLCVLVSTGLLWVRLIRYKLSNAFITT
jgi:cytochrome oxidase Cu insertion factor (SCO1/SenC/PrrC family)